MEICELINVGLFKTRGNVFKYINHLILCGKEDL